MVMHARKLPRISDGFSEKHQAHGYENSKYSNKYRYGNHDKRDSPSTNSLRSSSPDSRSQSPRYHKSNYYKIREKERERERDRDREYKEYRDRERDGSRGSRSPKERRRDVRDHRDARVTHERMNSVQHKKDEKGRLMRVGEWSEHVSSSGKKYYYNCRTEVSQWEKPPEWLEWERNHPPCGKEPSLSSHRSQIDKNRPDKHSTLGEGYRESRDVGESERDRRDVGDTARERREVGDSLRERRDFRPDNYERRESRKYVTEGATDMDISSGESTPTSESHDRGNASIIMSHLGASSYNIISPHFSRPGSKLSNSNMGPLSTSVPSSFPSAGSALLASTDPTGGQNSNNFVVAGTSSSSLGNSVAMAVPQLLNSHPRLMALSSEAKCCNTMDTSSSSLIYAQDGNGNNNNNNRPQVEPLTIAPNSNNIGVGPPTPTHSENLDGLDLRKIASPNSSLNSLHSLMPASSGSSSLSLTPSLANYYKETLLSHIQNWPAEGIEKQCQRLSEEAHTTGSIIMTKVSADLKMARSLVRLAEIQATLHEQRILFLRAQKGELEEIKSQNCFMNDT